MWLLVKGTQLDFLNTSFLGTTYLLPDKVNVSIIALIDMDLISDISKCMWYFYNLSFSISYDFLSFFIELSSCSSLIKFCFIPLIDLYVNYPFFFYSHSSFWILISTIDLESLRLINSFIPLPINIGVLECFNSITTITNSTHPNPISGILDYVLLQKFSFKWHQKAK